MSGADWALVLGAAGLFGVGLGVGLILGALVARWIRALSGDPALGHRPPPGGRDDDTDRDR